MTDDELHIKLINLDWIKILNEAIKNRPSSWNDDPVREWRNASDEICSEVIRALGLYLILELPKTDTAINDVSELKFGESSNPKQKESTKNCKRCNGKGSHIYDENYDKICEVCCIHEQGFWELKEHYGNDNGKMCCLRGCGFTITKDQYRIIAKAIDLNKEIKKYAQKTKT